MFFFNQIWPTISNFYTITVHNMQRRQYCKNNGKIKLNMSTSDSPIKVPSLMFLPATITLLLVGFLQHGIFDHDWLISGICYPQDCKTC